MTDLPIFRAPLAILLIDFRQNLAQTFVACNRAVVDISAHSGSSGSHFHRPDKGLVARSLGKLLVIGSEGFSDPDARIFHRLLGRFGNMLARVHIPGQRKQEMRSIQSKLCALIGCARPAGPKKLAGPLLARAIQVGAYEFDVGIRAVLAWHTAQRSSGVISHA